MARYFLKSLNLVGESLGRTFIGSSCRIDEVFVHSDQHPDITIELDDRPYFLCGPVASTDGPGSRLGRRMVLELLGGRQGWRYMGHGCIMTDLVLRRGDYLCCA
jgi:hypothetical protein